MRLRRVIWIALCLLCVAGAWLFWHAAGRLAAGKNVAATALVATGSQTGAAPLTNPALVSAAAAKTNRLAYRLSNTTRTIGELTGDRRAILLENALIDSSLPVNFSFPKNLLSQGDPGAYIVQSRGPINAAFRALLARAGAEIISYIPNDAYLVRLTAGGADGLAAQPPVQSVIPYEPYYKIQLSLLGPAVNQDPLPAGAVLNLGLFAGDAPQTISAIEKLGGTILARDTSPFGPVVRVRPPADWTALAALPGVQIVEAYHPRVPANDLSRVTVGVATNTLVSSNYMNLTGLNVVVAVNDSGIDATHPDFTTGGNRVIGDAVQSLVDTNGHGTHVAGIIAGNGTESLTTMINGVQMAEGSVSNADFRGKAPLATLYSVAGIGGYDPNAISDRYMQEQAALTNALISNNSWSYGNNTYDLAAASYDAATRDALPHVTGSQPVLFVFAAGNDGYIGRNGGGGDNNGGSVTPDTITSPGTAKNVITAAALEQMRNITNSVTNLDGSVTKPWQPETDTGYQVAYYSSRGNVGVGIEGANGRLKPDVAAPGTFVVSTRSAQWATNAYYNPTNYDDNTYTGQSVGVNGINYYSIFVPQNAVSVTVQIQRNKNSPNPMPAMPIYVSQYDYPDPTDPATYDFVETTNEVLIPPDPDGTGAYLTQIQGTGFNYAVVNTNSQTVNYNLFTEVTTTNDMGNYYQVLEGMNDGLGGYYRYESGTSMAAADVSGTLALMEDFFTNQMQMTPSPALLKAMLINGARPTLPYYNMRVGNPINNEGWGLINLPNSLPLTIQTNFSGGAVPSTIFIQDQSRTNALATGDSHSFTITISSNAPAAPLRLTLTWTDPPGDPVAAIKLVNGLELVVTNKDNPTNPVVYYGNDISANGFNTAENVTNTVSADAINNVQNVFIPQPVGTNYTVTVIGREVNVNAVSAQTNLYAGPPNGAGVYAPNVVQDYALVISCGDAFTVTDNGIVSNPTGDQNITFVTTTNTPLFNQFVGANSPVLNTNTVSFTSNTAFGGNAVDTLGTTNQWHFYVVTNTLAYTNAAFIIFSPPTLSIPRMGVFAGSVTNATMPQANIDLYVSTDPNLLLFHSDVISNCINEIDNGASVNNASLARGGAKFIVYSNSAPGEVYYIGVKSEDQMAAEYTFLAVFSQTPFSQMDHGDEILTGVTIPAPIPGGNPSVPGFVDLVAVGVYPMNAASVIVTNLIQQSDVGDLVSSLSFNNTTAVLMNHDSPNSAGTFGFVYDDSGTVNPTVPPWPAGYALQHSDGPGSLRDFAGQNVSSGVWVFHVANSVEPFTGNVQLFSLRIHPQLPLTSGVTNTIPPHTMIYDFVDVPAGATNLTINATNVTQTPDLANPPLMVLKFGSQPTLTNADKGPVALTNPPPGWVSGPGLGNSLSVGPTDVPPIQPGRYWVGITNQSGSTQDVYVVAVILPPNPSGATTDFASTGSTRILDDAVTYSDVFVTNTLPIVSVNIGIEAQDPRISDLVFHLISPDGTRILLMENRGGADTNGAGVSVVVTNVTATGSTVTVTNSLAGAAAGDYTVGQTVAGWKVNTNQVSLVNDPLNASPANSNLLALASGSLSTTFTTVTGYTYTVKFAYRGPGIAGWWRAESNALDSINGNNGIIPTATNYTTVWTNGFEGKFAADYVTNQVVAGWTVNSNQVSLVTDANNACRGSNFLALANGVISTNLSTIAGQTYTLSFAYRGPGIAAMWRGENNANDSIGANNGTLMNGAGFVAGEVSQAFSFNGTSYVSIPDSPLLDGFTSRITIEAWVKVNSFAGAGWDCILAKGNSSWELRRYSNGSTAAFTTVGLSNQDLGGTKNINDGQWHHVAGVYDGINKYLYVDGVLDASAPASGTILQNSYPLYIGGNAETQGKLPGYFWNGFVDEASLYSRALSPSEIKAIYQKGSAGKFDSSSSFSTNLAEVKVSLAGQTPTTIYGSNTAWQTYSNTFTATTNQTLLSIAGLQPGILLDEFVLTRNVINSTVTYTNG
ncbi:MAG: LamG-like jellyroll fold domain-containing protein, partial [Verrucomicrobiota bacterium]